MATDVAFTLGVLAVAGRRLPPLLRVFLLTLAITDDVLSVVVLSVSGTTHVRLEGLVALIAITLVGFFVSRRATSNVASVLLLIVLWICFAWANVEPALAGVLAGVLVSTHSPSRSRLERDVTRLSVGVVLPLFALVACGLHWSNVRFSGAVGTVVLATVVVRLVGKTLGITAGVALARLLHFRLDPSLSWPLVVTTALLCAIGFTVPLLFATKLFGSQSTLYAGYALGLLMSSAIAALLGGVLLRARHRLE
jgi:NhaA family Na+:H+ antiporter